MASSMTSTIFHSHFSRCGRQVLATHFSLPLTLSQGLSPGIEARKTLRRKIAQLVCENKYGQVSLEVSGFRFWEFLEAADREIRDLSERTYIVVLYLQD